MPELDEVERLLQDFLACLRQRLHDDPVWGPLSLAAAKRRAVEHIEAATLCMDETLTAELPAIRKLVASLEETVRQAQGQLPRKGLGETTGAYLTYLHDRYQYLAFKKRWLPSIWTWGPICGSFTMSCAPKPTAPCKCNELCIINYKLRFEKGESTVLRAIGEGHHTLDAITLAAGLTKQHVSQIASQQGCPRAWPPPPADCGLSL